MADAARAGTDAAGALIAVRALAKVYRVGVETIHALRGLDLEIGRNEMVAIMGSSGSGKSTLMNMLGCLDRPTSGSYLLDGEDVSRMDDETLSRVRGRKIGFIFQSFNLIPELTIVENVEVPLFYQGVPAADRRARSRAAGDVDAVAVMALKDRIAGDVERRGDAWSDFDLRAVVIAVVADLGDAAVGGQRERRFAVVGAAKQEAVAAS